MNRIRISQLSAFCLGLVLATFLSEIYLHLVEISPAWKILPAAEISFYGPDKDVGYRIRANVQGLWLSENRAKKISSSQGLRDHETEFRPPLNTYRIAIVGDSITEGLQVDVDELFSELMEKELTLRYGKTEVINLGMSGASPAVQMARMKSLGLQFSPNLMVFVVNVSDFASSIIVSDAEYSGYVDSGNGEYVLGKGFRENPSYKFRTSFNGHLFYQAMDNIRLIRLINTRKNRGLMNQPSDTHPTVPQQCNGSRLGLLAEGLRDGGKTEKLRPDVLRTKKVLTAFRADLQSLSKMTNAPVVLAIRGLSPICGNEKQTTDKVAKGMKNFLSIGDEITIVDLDNAVDGVLRENYPKNSRLDMYGFGARLGQGHLNPFGHQVVAKALINSLGISKKRHLHEAGQS